MGETLNPTKQLKSSNTMKEFSEGENFSKVLPAKKFYKGRDSKVISFGPGLNQKESLNQTFTKLGKERDDGSESPEREKKIEKKEEIKTLTKRAEASEEIFKKGFIPLISPSKQINKKCFLKIFFLFAD
jgi:hypothetical protein